jgi:NAD+ kinase
MDKTYTLLTAPTPAAMQAAENLPTKGVPPEKADFFLVLGGDGFILQMIHTYRHFQKPFYGLHCGTRGFLMNQHAAQDLEKFFAESQCYSVPLLEATICKQSGETQKIYALNEITLWRRHSRPLQVNIHLKTPQKKLLHFRGDGLLCAGPIGSSAYNRSLGGPILPTHSNLLSLMPISPLSPRAWRGTLLNATQEICWTVLSEELPNATADHKEVEAVHEVHICQSTKEKVEIYLAPPDLDERLLTASLHS